MSTVILLSSSPLPVFARSPTPVCDIEAIQDYTPGRMRFKASKSKRDGLPAVFSTARQVLKQKHGAENAKIISPGRNRFRSSQEENYSNPIEILEVDLDKPLVSSGQSSSSKVCVCAPQPVSLEPQLEENASIQPSAATEAETLVETPQSLTLERATVRRNNWTPPKAQATWQDEEKPVEYSAGFMNGMLSSFAYSNPAEEINGPGNFTVTKVVKRRRVDVEDKLKTGISVTTASKLSRARLVPPKRLSTRIHSPKKKPLTITGLATSASLRQDESVESPMLQYLTSSQAQMQDISLEQGMESDLQKAKDLIKKLKDSRRTTHKTSLLPPDSAMKTYEEQDTIFGSASQLAREDSPTFLREIIEATKESESFMRSSPVSSQICTQPFSKENSPKQSTSRYRKTRNLWSAAGRDEDNALLHVDTVDLSDTPTVRAAFTGKDVMLQPGTKTDSSTRQHSESTPKRFSSFSVHNKRAVMDIDNFVSPASIPTRALSTTSVGASPHKSSTRLQSIPVETGVSGDMNEALKPASVPIKPNYEGLTIHELNKHIKNYGFKAMRKRDKMIELLDRCWEEKYGLTQKETNGVPQVHFGAFLSEVHDVAARPEPKTSKPRARKKKSEGSATAPEDKSIKKPRQRKMKDDNAAQISIKQKKAPKSKTPRIRKSKDALDGRVSIVDVDSVWSTIPDELKALETFEEWAKPERKLKTKSNVIPIAITALPESQPKAILTPPTNTEEIIIPSSPPAFDDQAKPDLNRDQGQEEEQRLREPLSSASFTSQTKLGVTQSPPALSSQITTAIQHQSHTSRNSPTPVNRNIYPTWYQKLLLYDPIILEDLALWLNTEGFKAIGEDREASALEVREWCEERGICCLWKGGRRGNKLVAVTKMDG